MNLSSRLIELATEFADRFQTTINFRTARSFHSTDSLEFQKLEPRTMLAGDVTVFIDNINLMVVGDDAANQIQIIGTANGGARVIGLDGTTINGGDSPFVSSLPGLRTAFVTMNQGNDNVDIHNALFNKGVVLHGNGGDDMMMVRNSSIGSLNIQGGNGSDLIQIENVWAIKSSTIGTQSGDDNVVVYNHAAGEDISIQTGDGHDTIAIDRMGMFGTLNINTASGNDQVLMAGKTWIGRSSNLLLGAGDDFLAVMPGQNGGTSQLQKFTNVDGGGGNDNVAFDAAVSMQQSVDIDGNVGTDNLNYAGSDLNGTNILRFENFGFDVSAAMDQVYSQLADEGIDPTLFGGSASLVLGIEVSDINLDYTEGQAAQRIDPALVVNGVADTVVTSATVTINGFVANQDILEFVDVGNVTGVFDDATGVLTFTGDGTLADYEGALRSVSYRNSSESPSEAVRSVEVAINTADTTVSDTRTLNVFGVADIPVLDVSQDQFLFDQDDNNLTRPAVIDANLNLSDADTTEFTSATVQIIGGGQGGDLLAAVDANGITSSYDAATGLLTLSGAASVGDYQTALRSVTFDNSNTLAPLGLRTVRFEISDGQSTVTGDIDISVVASQTIEVSATTTSLQYGETDPETVVDPGFSINAAGGDANATVKEAVVSFESGFDASQDTLSFTPLTGITGNYNAATGILTFTGDASASDYETILRSVTFVNSSFGDFDYSTADRVVSFAVTRDGLTATDSRTIELSEIATEQQLIARYLQVNNLTSEMTDSGLHFFVTQEGDGNFPNENSTVNVNYRGTLLNGFEFDANDDINFGLQSVIQGWTEGIPKFSTGGSGFLIIPSDLAYGANGTGSDIPPFATLFFEIDLLGFT